MKQRATDSIQWCASCGHIKLRHEEGCTVEGCTCLKYVDPGPGHQTCPRRMGEFGPWDYKEMLDHWQTSRWKEGDVWPKGFDKPRSCSFCGSVHPDDFFELLEQGWEIEHTGKNYKAYLNPPGQSEYKKGLIQAMRDQALDDFESDYVYPTPPVKLYTQHLSQEQCDKLNRRIRTGGTTS